MKLFCRLIYDRSVERLWTAKKEFMYFEVRETQSGLGTSRTGYLVGLGTQSDWAPNRDWVPVGLGTQGDWVTGSTGTQSPSRGLELVHP